MIDSQFLDMADMANKMLRGAAKAQTLSAPITPATHGSDIARMGADEASGYAKAMLDMIDWLQRQALTRPSSATADCLRVANVELSVYRNAKLNEGPQ